MRVSGAGAAIFPLTAHNSFRNLIIIIIIIIIIIKNEKIEWHYARTLQRHFT